jgi:hypothetical protein
MHSPSIEYRRSQFSVYREKVSETLRLFSMLQTIYMTGAALPSDHLFTGTK